MKFYRMKGVAGFLFSLFLLLGAITPAYGMVQNTDGPSTYTDNTEYAFVRFTDAPIASYNGQMNGYAATKPSKGQKLNLNSPAAQKYGQRLESQQTNYKKWLADHYPQVQVVTDYKVTYNGLGLKLNGATLKDISAGPGAAEAGYSATYQKAMSTSTALIHADAIWTALGGQPNAGAGIKVGVIDSGIDQTHPFLQPNDGMRYPDGFPKGDTRYTSAKVIVAKVFNQNPWLTAKAVESHGTHVSGTIAGKAGTMPPLGNKPLSGVAPGAYLGNYNVFPGDVANAKSLFIAKAVEEAVIDGMDVLNLSLGGTPHKGADLLDMTVNSAVDAGVVVAIAAGNEGPGNYTIGSPGTADKVITVAATTNSHTFAISLESGAFEGGSTPATTGSDGAEVKQEINGEYALWADYAGGDKLACAGITGTPLAGKIALIQRGACAFSDKINNAEAAGAVGVIIYNRDDVNEPIAMSTPGTSIPAVMISRDAGYKLVAYAGDHHVKITYPPAEIQVQPNLLADFSSWGPTPNYTLKPDVAAPGVNIYSSVVGGGYELYQGTSMATPHVAGSAAVLLAYSRANGLGWGPDEVKAALMGTAGNLAGSVTGVNAFDPLKAGAGLIDLSRAMNPPAMAFPSSLSFGLVRPVGSQTYQMSFTLKNSTNQSITYSIANDKNLTFSQSIMTLGAGESAKIAAKVEYRGTLSKGQSGTPELVRGYITVSSNQGDIQVPYLYVIDYNQ